MIDPFDPDFANTPVSPQRPSFDYSPADPAAPPWATIITPFYNTGAIFHETARSILQQSCQQWEWVIVNDASTDPEALRVLERYRHLDARIRVLDHEQNRGPGAARNTAIRAARTEYLVLLDSDNLLEPTAIEKWCWFLESHREFGFVKGYSVGFGAQQYLWTQGFHNGKAFLNSNMVDTTSSVRRSVHQAAGGYDETIREGLEDWDFWLRCANQGYWGGVIPEYLDWYRRRPAHTDRWADWDNALRERAFRERLRERYPQLWNGRFPEIEPRPNVAYETVPDALPCENRLRKAQPRLLMILPWLVVGGSDKFNLDLLQQLTGRGWQVSIATTLESDDPWLAQFARYTPDIFLLHNFLRLADYPRFLRYLIHSRQMDAVLISHSELGYLLLPYLRAHFPDVTFADLCHIEVEHWKNGGYPRLSIEYQEQLDRSLVVSEHLKKWMVERGADAERVEVCYINVDTDKWRPDPERRAQVRRELNLDQDIALILFAGRIQEQKQPRVLAETMFQLKQQNIDFLALIAGEGPDRAWLASFVTDHGLQDQVRLLGAVSSQRVKELMAAADVYFLPSQWEGIALSIYEAMASGLAVVGADVGGQRELVTPKCGILIPRGDPETQARQYADALSQLLRDPTARRTLGQAARARVSANFRIEQMGERMDARLKDAIHRHASQARPAPTLGLGRACAAQTIEYTRLSEFANELWLQHTQSPMLPPAQLLDPDTARWRTLVYYAITRFPLLYYWGVVKKKVRVKRGDGETVRPGDGVFS